MISSDDVPGWAGPVVSALIGGAGVKMLSVWLENRRLTRRDYRETLESQIRVLQRQVASLYERLNAAERELGHLEEALDGERETVDRLDQENARLRARLEELGDGKTARVD